jgi:hypothetical protein
LHKPREISFLERIRWRLLLICSLTRARHTARACLQLFDATVLTTQTPGILDRPPQHVHYFRATGKALQDYNWQKQRGKGLPYIHCFVTYITRVVLVDCGYKFVVLKLINSSHDGGRENICPVDPTHSFHMQLFQKKEVALNEDFLSYVLTVIYNEPDVTIWET